MSKPAEYQEMVNALSATGKVHLTEFHVKALYTLMQLADEEAVDSMFDDMERWQHEQWDDQDALNDANRNKAKRIAA